MGESFLIYNKNLIDMETELTRKSVKIETPVHQILKKYCDKRGLKIQKFLEMLIVNNCSE